MSAHHQAKSPLTISEMRRWSQFLDPFGQLSLRSTGVVVVLDRSTGSARQTRRTLTRQVKRVWSTICRCRAGFKTFGGSRPATSPCRATDRRRSSSDCRSLPRAGATASFPTASGRRTSYANCSRSPR